MLVSSLALAPACSSKCQIGKESLTKGCCTDLAWQTGLHTGIATPLTEMMHHGHHPNRPVQPQEILLVANTPLPEDIPIIRAQGTAESMKNPWASAL